ncbi:helix-turn-helix domain-containing protein [Devosia sp. LjRoot16]|jgi:DNA-binding HxlR family transcriptional regulator|uniref:winged helix-turn-helix transcriptional regulator n=1 Tax=unclassified Devosia TaxID=196773 RepID=UPI0006F776C4|nr:helix-turn-helix domain-containing protein [Devosia sp. Root105]KQV09052.1 HxlR family transcriptional regulator [Devosia sp. Root105]
MSKPNLQPVEIDYAAEGAANCKALGQILDRVGDKWTIMVVGVLSGGTMRFNALQRAIPGVSHRMLAMTLRGLERDGLVKRTSFATIPPRVDYELTERGHSLHVPLLTLAAWARSQQSGIAASRQQYDVQAEQAD